MGGADVGDGGIGPKGEVLGFGVCCILGGFGHADEWLRGPTDNVDAWVRCGGKRRIDEVESEV